MLPLSLVLNVVFKNVKHICAFQHKSQHLFVKVIMHSVYFVLADFAEGKVVAQIRLFAKLANQIRKFRVFVKLKPIANYRLNHF